MVTDSRRDPNPNIEDAVMTGLVRSNPILSLASTDPISIKAKQQQQIAIGLTATQVDDPWLVMYVGPGVCWQIMLPQRRISPPQTLPNLQDRLLEQYPHKERLLGSNHGTSSCLQRWCLFRS
jgi:hypothetical protein